MTKDVLKKRSVFYTFFDLDGYYGYYRLLFPLFEFSYVSTHCGWEISVVIIISFAMNLSMKFKQFSDRLKRTEVVAMNSFFWNEMLQHYLALCDLVDEANKILAPIIMVLTFFDFFFLCERIYRQFRWYKKSIEFDFANSIYPQ